jgi:hypothetical protein
VYNSLHDCCSDKFPNSITSCCDAAGSGGCTLSVVVQWLPDWANNHCYEKVTSVPRLISIILLFWQFESSNITMLLMLLFKGYRFD